MCKYNGKVKDEAASFGEYFPATAVKSLMRRQTPPANKLSSRLQSAPSREEDCWTELAANTVFEHSYPSLC